MPMLSRRRVLAGAAAAAGLWFTDVCAEAQDWARTKLDGSPRHREYVAIQTAAGRTVNTFVVYPEVAAKAPVVLLIHEIFGLSDWAKLMADELAAKGFIVVAPDLLSGMNPSTTPAGATGMSGHMDASMTATHTPTATSGTDSYPSVDAVTKAVSGLPEAQVTADLDAVADYAQRKIASANGQMSVAGFCWGGGKAFLFATHRPGLRGAYVFYGPPPATGEMAKISAPVYGFYAGNDARITTTVPETVSAMQAAGKRFEPVTYAGAGHGFMRAGQAPDASDDNKKAWNDGFARLVKLLGQP